MAGSLKLLEITGSPNNVKVRVALGIKGLEYEREPLELTEFPGDRSRIVAASTQPRTPVLLHGETVIFDSGAILRYLEANFPDTPRLYSEDYHEMGAIEEWELLSRTELGAPVGAIFGQVFAPQADPEVCRRASEAMHEVTGRIEVLLAKQDFLMGAEPKAADCACAPLVGLAMVAPEQAQSPIAQFFLESFQLGEGRDRTRAWVGRVLSFDPVFEV